MLLSVLRSHALLSRLYALQTYLLLLIHVVCYIDGRSLEIEMDKCCVGQDVCASDCLVLK